MSLTTAQDVEGCEHRSPVEPAMWQGRDPGWEELLELADRVGPSSRLAGLDDRALEQQVRIGLHSWRRRCATGSIWSLSW